MKNTIKIVVSIMVVATLAACGAMPRGSRTPFSMNASQIKEDIGASVGVSASQVDLYRLIKGTGAPQLAAYYLTQGINVDGLGLDLGAGAQYIEVDVATVRVTGHCLLLVRLAADAQYNDNLQDVYEFAGSITSSSNGMITCNVADKFSSSVTITINPQAVNNNNTALITIIDPVFSGVPFVSSMPFEITQQE